MRSREECEKQRSRGRRRREVGLSNQNRPRLAEGGPYSPRDAREHHPLDVQAAVAALGRPRCVLQPHAPIGPFSLTPTSHVAPSRPSIYPFPPFHAFSPCRPATCIRPPLARQQLCLIIAPIHLIVIISSRSCRTRQQCICCRLRVGHALSCCPIGGILAGPPSLLPHAAAAEAAAAPTG